MAPYWVEFEDGSKACVEETSSAAATAKAEQLTGKKVGRIDILPYPAEPRIGEHGGCPPFCYTPDQCKGRTSCPKNHACDD